MSILLKIKERFQKISKNLPFAVIIGGCLVLFGYGICLAMIITFSFFAQSTSQSPPSDTETLLNQAKRDLDNGQSQKVLDALKPNRNQFLKVDEKAAAYEYLGQAEIQLGHFQFAAMYFENMYALQPTAEHLYMLAATYDAGGDLIHALKNYRTLTELNTPDALTYHSLAEQRIRQLLEILTPVPSTSP